MILSTVLGFALLAGLLWLVVSAAVHVVRQLKHAATNGDGD